MSVSRYVNTCTHWICRGGVNADTLFRRSLLSWLAILSLYLLNCTTYLGFAPLLQISVAIIIIATLPARLS